MLRITILKFIIISILGFLGGYIVAFFEDKYQIGIKTAMIIFDFIGMITMLIIQS